MFLHFLFILFAFSFDSFKAKPPITSYYWNVRTFQCDHYDHSNLTRCALHLPKRESEVNPLCHEETDQKNVTRVYCRIGCEEGDEATVLAKIPSWNHKCNIYYSYNLERRWEDWFLWRSEPCLSTSVSFTIRCGFPRNPAIFYRDNSHLFEYEDGS
ncbi:unnamed protein product, partial [Mesorhabditis belari]|uniref:Secreted protein n=1 Tax=Mesorhabditis belari TaxID=2138241 RepID=A0AAF3FM31_9BILA